MSRARLAIAAKARGPTAQTLATTVVAQGFMMVSGIVAARALGAEGRGTFALLWLFPSIIAMLGGLGIPQANAFYVARDPAAAGAIVRISVRLAGMLAVALCLIYGLGLVATGGWHFSTLEVLLSVAFLPFLLAQSLGVTTLLGLQHYTSYNLGRVTPAVLYAFSASILLVSGKATVASILAACLGSWALGSIGAWALALRVLRDRRDPTDVSRSEILSFGIRGVVGTVSPVEDVRIDQLFVGFLIDPRALGLYVSAVAFTNLPRLVAQAIGSVNYPRVASSADPRVAWPVVLRAAKIGLPMITAVVAVLLLTVSVLLPFLFGNDFREALDFAYILLLAAFFLSVRRLLSDLARGLGHPGYGSLTELINLAVLMLGVFVFASPATTTGIATAVLVAGISSAVVISSLLLGLHRRQLSKTGPHESEPAEQVESRLGESVE